MFCVRGWPLSAPRRSPRLRLFSSSTTTRSSSKRARAEFTDAQVLANIGGRGASSARNTAIELAGGDILAFLDDDAVAGESWLEELTRPYEDPSVIGTGGMPMPRWEDGEAPAWLPLEFYWTIGCGYRGLPERVEPVRNPIGASMSFRRSVFERIGGFSTGFGPAMSTPSPHGGGEEGEFGIRAVREFPGSAVVHVPRALVEHGVPRERTEFSYFRRRCWLEGRAKALLSIDHGSAEGLSSERTYTLKTLPTGVLMGFSDAIRGDLAGLQRAGAILAGLSFTAAGYIFGRIIERR